MARFTEADINNYISANAAEGLNLEFKTAPNFDGKKLDRDTKKVLGECLSAFSNSDGGVVVWGIETEKIDGIDCAVRKSPIQSITLFRSFLDTCCQTFLNPQNIQIVSSVVADNDEGFLILEIPKGVDRPYMSRAPGHQKYFRRNHDACVPLEHYEVLDLINARTSPSLLPSLRPRVTSNSGYEMELVISNPTNLVAKFPFASVRIGDRGPMINRYGTDGNGRFPWRLVPGSGWRNPSFSAGTDDVVHGGQEIVVALIDVRTEKHPNQPHRWSVEDLEENDIVEIQVDCACEGLALQKFAFFLSKASLQTQNPPPPKRIT